MVSIKPKTIAATIPAEVKLNIPPSNPKIPFSLAASKAPWIKEWPKLVIGTKVPAPNHFINLSYNPNESKNKKAHSIC